MTWSNQYVGIPFRERGRDRMGCDCWGLVRLILLEQFHLELPDLSYESAPESSAKAFESDAWRTNWKAARCPGEKDILILNYRGFPGHVGLMLNEWQFIHARPGGTAVDSIHDPYWSNKIAGVYRYAG